MSIWNPQNLRFLFMVHMAFLFNFSGCSNNESSKEEKVEENRILELLKQSVKGRQEAKKALPELQEEFKKTGKAIQLEAAEKWEKASEKLSGASSAFNEFMEKPENKNLKKKLKELGPKAKKWLPQIMEKLRDEDSEIRQKAFSLLEKMSEESKEALNALKELSEEDWNEDISKKAKKTYENLIHKKEISNST